MNLLAIITMFVIVGIFFVLRIDNGVGIVNIDEVIPQFVSAAMQARGDLDTNWFRVSELPDFFKIPSYTFSSYILFVHPILMFLPADLDLWGLRLVNLFLQLGAVVFLALALRTLKWRRSSILVVLALFAVAPGLVQDAHMARPESFLVFLFAMVVYFSVQSQTNAMNALLVGLAIGLGVATKVSFLSVLLIVGPTLLFETYQSPRLGFRIFIFGLLGTVLGFIIGAPYALFNFDVLMNGIKVLLNQYSGAHPPHSSLTYSYWGQMFWMIKYLAILYSPLIIVGALICIFLKPKKVMLGLVLFIVFWLFYYATQKVFFERNLILVVVSMVVLIGFVVEKLPKTGFVMAAISLVPMTFWSVQIAAQSRWDFSARAEWETANIGSKIYYQWVYTPIDNSKTCSGVLGALDYNDDYSALFMAQRRDEGFKEIARFRGLFSIVPTSTLQTYLSSDVVYFSCPNQNTR